MFQRALLNTCITTHSLLHAQQDALTQYKLILCLTQRNKYCDSCMVTDPTSRQRGRPQMTGQ
jgi:hypothetical protein